MTTAIQTPTSDPSPRKGRVAPRASTPSLAQALVNRQALHPDGSQGSPGPTVVPLATLLRDRDSRGAVQSGAVRALRAYWWPSNDVRSRPTWGLDWIFALPEQSASPAFKRWPEGMDAPRCAGPAPSR